MSWFDLADEREKRQAVIKAVMKILVLQNAGGCSNSAATCIFS